MANTKITASLLDPAQTSITSLGTLSALTISGNLTVDTSTLTKTADQDPNKLTPLQQVERLTAATKPQPIDFKGIAQDTIQAFKPTFKEKALDTALQAGSDIAVSYVTNKLLGKTFAGSLATSSPFMTNPYTAAATFALLDMYAPSVGSAARQGTGFGIGANLAGFPRV